MLHDWENFAVITGERGRGVPVPRPAFTQFWDRPYQHVNPSVIRGLRAGIKGL